MSHAVCLTAVLDASVDDLWMVSRHIDVLFCHLMPHYFAKSEYLQGYGEPGSIRLTTTGPAIEPPIHLKERIDKFCEATKTFGYTVLEGDPCFEAFSAEIQFHALDDIRTTASWTATFTPADAMGGPPELVKVVGDLILKTLEKGARLIRSFEHTETVDAAPDALWAASKNVDQILLTGMPDHFVSATTISGYGGPGTVRLIKFGPAVEFATEMIERLDFIDMATMNVGYSIIKGDSRYKLFSATMEFKAGPSDGTTTALWKTKYLTVNDEDVPPVHIRDLVSNMWSTLAVAAKANYSWITIIHKVLG